MVFCGGLSSHGGSHLRSDAIRFAECLGGGADDFRIWGNVTARGNFGYVGPDLKRWRWWMEAQLGLESRGRKWTNC